MLTRAEVAEHSTSASSWIILNDSVYDITDFMAGGGHPGGQVVLKKWAGKDATEQFNLIHSAEALDRLSPSSHLGNISSEDGETLQVTTLSTGSSSEERVKPERTGLHRLLSLLDFEVAAEKLLQPTTWAYFKSAADDELASKRDRQAWSNIRFRPRMFRDVREADLRTKIMGQEFDFPFFIAPASGAKQAHPEGEVLFTKAAGKKKVLHWVSNFAGRSKEDLADAALPGQPLFLQIYLMSDRDATEKQVRTAERLGFKAIALTIDAVVIGNRERDTRANLPEDGNREETVGVIAGGVNTSLFKQNLSWDDIEWLRSITSLPIAIKGVQRWEDVLACAEHGVKTIYLSNHGGRQLEGAPTAVRTLLEIRQRCPAVFETCDILVDGGILRGSDVVKALCLGARGVGVGRPFLYSVIHGEKGPEAVIDILINEVRTTMGNIGASSIKDLNANYVSWAGLWGAPHL
ncbi:putative mitochondrial cytochrome b2 [Meredithblackwellia eburnea MCA 4105]